MAARLASPPRFAPVPRFQAIDSGIVNRTYLEMRSPDALRPARVPEPAPAIERVVPPSGAVSRQLYEAVGREWSWTDRQGWPIEEWDRWAADAATWIGRVGEQRIGYGELYPRRRGELELAYFGLLPGWRGRGYGGHMLTEIVRRAWETPGIGRLWLSTGSLDSEAALPGYLKRGFVPFATRKEPRPPQPGPDGPRTAW